MGVYVYEGTGEGGLGCKNAMYLCNAGVVRLEWPYVINLLDGS